MNDLTDLTLVANLRQHIEGDAALIESERRLSAAISAATANAAPAHRSRVPRRRLMLGGTLAVALGTAVAVVVAVTGVPVRPAGPPPWVAGPPVPAWIGTSPGFGTARTQAQLLDYSSRAASAARAVAPGLHDWAYVLVESAKSSAGSGGFLFGPPDERVTGAQWIRLDHLEYASRYPARESLPPGAVTHGRLVFSPGGAGFDMTGWKSVGFRYLSSLPADPGKLAAVIAASNRPWGPDGRNAAIFNAIFNLMEGEGTDGVVLPPALSANLYRVLSELPGVHFEPTTDLAGRRGIGFSLVTGWYKQEIVINPSTYAYLGELTVAVTAHTLVGTDGTRSVKKGQVLGWVAALKYGVVRRPGQVPS